MSEDALYPVVIVGGGLTGMPAACVLARRGIDCAVLDAGDGKAMPPHENTRTTTLNPFAMEMLAGLGVRSRATPITAIRVGDGAGEQKPLLDWQAEAGEPPLAFVLRNAELLAEMRRLVAAESRIAMHHATAIADYAPPDAAGGYAAATLTDDSGRHWRAALVLACDGAGSVLREAAGIRTLTRTPGQTAIVADIALEIPHHNTAWQRFLAGGPVALMPVDDDRMASLVWTLGDDAAAAMMAADDDTFSRALTSTAASPFGGLTAAGTRHAWPLRLCHAPRPYAKGGRLALLGDAAHAIHPLAGQGFNLAAGDIAVLADVLEAARGQGTDCGSDGVLAEYARRRAAEVTAMTLATDGLNQLFTHAPAPLRNLGAAGMALFDKTPLKRFARDFAAGQFGKSARG